MAPAKAMTMPGVCVCVRACVCVQGINQMEGEEEIKQTVIFLLETESETMKRERGKTQSVTL
jgi:hypothetical protein